MLSPPVVAFALGIEVPGAKSATFVLRFDQGDRAAVVSSSDATATASGAHAGTETASSKLSFPAATIVAIPTLSN
jgi:hypothetical protein